MVLGGATLIRDATRVVAGVFASPAFAFFGAGDADDVRDATRAEALPAGVEMLAACAEAGVVSAGADISAPPDNSAATGAATASDAAFGSPAATAATDEVDSGVAAAATSTAGGAAAAAAFAGAALRIGWMVILRFDRAEEDIAAVASEWAESRIECESG